MSALRRLIGFLGPYRVQAIVSLSLLFAMVGADLLIPRLTQRIIDFGILANDLRVVLTTSVVMLGASLVSAALALANNYLSVRVAMHVGADLRSALFRKVQRFSFGNLDRLQTGKLLVRSTSDVNMVQMIVMMSLRILSRAPIWVIGATVLLVLTSRRLRLRPRHRGPGLALLPKGPPPLPGRRPWIVSTRSSRKTWPGSGW